MIEPFAVREPCHHAPAGRQSPDRAQIRDCYRLAVRRDARMNGPERGWKRGTFFLILRLRRSEDRQRNHYSTAEKRQDAFHFPFSLQEFRAGTDAKVPASKTRSKEGNTQIIR